METITRKEAREAGITKYYTGVPCKNGHLCQRWTCSAMCVQCSAIYHKNHEAKHRAERTEYQRQYVAEHREEMREYMKLYMRDYRAKRKAEGRPL